MGFLKEKAHLVYSCPHSQPHQGSDLLSDRYLLNDVDRYLLNDVEDRMNNLMFSFGKAESPYTGETLQLLHPLLPETKFDLPLVKVE